MFSDNIKITLLVYIFLTTVIFVMKPPQFFTEEGKVKHLGVGDDKTLFPFYTVIFVVSIFIYIFLHLSK
jgi:hypothetical protein